MEDGEVGDYNFNMSYSNQEIAFKGIRLGDVTGNWHPPESESTNRIDEDNYSHSIPSINVTPGEVVKLPIYFPDEVEIEVKGTGSELCQDILEKKKYLDYKNNYNDWNSFCTDSLGLDGYWEFNEVSHLTGVTLDEAKITININGKTIFDGDYYSLLNKLFSSIGSTR